MNIKKIAVNLSRLLSPKPPIGGLEITDSAIRFLDIKKEGVATASLRLPPGIIESGRIKEGQQPALVAALKRLHLQLTADSKRMINVVLTLSDSNVYIQSFNVSKVAEENLTEAADLNLRMLSPIPIETSYYSWQKIGESEGGGGAIELLGAFAPADSIDDIIFALHESAFGVAAVEFASLSLVRQLNELKILDSTFPYLIIYVATEGLDFIVVRNGSLYFDYFYPWSLVQGDGRSISFEGLKDAIEAEAIKVFNFYTSHWGGQIKNLLIVTPALEQELRNIVSEKFPSLKIELMNANQATVASGAALRGKISRNEDFDISLTSESASKIFEQEQVLRFVAIWRNIVFTVAGFLLLTFAVTDVYLDRSFEKITQVVESAVVNSAENTELKQLEDKAQDFNKLVDLVASAKGSSREMSPFLTYLNDLAAQKISFDRIYLQSLERPVIISGAAPSEEVILEFKRQLESQSQFADINLPFSSIIMRSDGQLAFEVSFLIKSLDFPVKVPEAENNLQDNKKKDESTLGEELVNVTEALKTAKPAAKGPLIIFGKLEFKSISDPVTVEVSALDEETANLFSTKLEESPNFYDVQIISGPTKTEDGRAKFTLKFSVTL